MNSTSGRSLGVYPTKKGLAEEMGARDLFGRGFGFSRFRDLGLDVTGWWESKDEEERIKREPYPAGHRYFRDCLRECISRQIVQLVNQRGLQGWFCTRTYKYYISVARAERLSDIFFARLTEAHKHVTSGAGPLHWISASEWQKRDVIHHHDLIYGAGLDSLSRKRWEDRWLREIGGGFARIHPADPKAAPYLAKYASKTQGGEIRCSLTWRGLRASESTSCCRA